MHASHSDHRGTRAPACAPAAQSLYLGPWASQTLDAPLQASHTRPRGACPPLSSISSETPSRRSFLSLSFLICKMGTE